MIVRAVVTVKLDGVAVKRYPFVRRLDDLYLDAHHSPTIPPAFGNIALAFKAATRVGAIRTHEPVTLQFFTNMIATDHSLPMRDGLFLLFDESFLGEATANNALATPATIDAYYAQ